MSDIGTIKDSYLKYLVVKYFILDLFRTHYSEACPRLYAVMVNYNDIKFVKVDEYDLLYCRISYLSHISLKPIPKCLIRSVIHTFCIILF